MFLLNSRNVSKKKKRVAVLGAGIQGTLMALMFRKHGYDVTIIDKSPNANDSIHANEQQNRDNDDDDATNINEKPQKNGIMGRTSTTGEARIHAGLEYSNDQSMKTAKYMLNSAMRFSSYTEYLVGHSIDWTRLKSERITCLVPYSSHVTPTEFEKFGDKLHNIYEEILAGDPSLSYLGERPPKILIGKTEIPKAVNSSYINAAYESIEVCIRSKKLKEVIRNALYEHGVQIVFNRTIVDVKRTDPKDGLGKFEVLTDIGGGNRFDVVVNCLWEGRATIDRRLGLDHRSDAESYRVKANVRLDNLPQFHKDIPSVSIMNGPYGDFVRYGPDDKVYFAWHPISPKLLTHNISEVISKFEGHAKSEFPPGYEDQIIDGHRKAFEMLFPGYDTSFFDNSIVGTGYVVANGLTDIDDPDSGFHERNDPPNLVVDGYVSVKTQKFTNAPYNVYLLEQELFEKDNLLE